MRGVLCEASGTLYSTLLMCPEAQFERTLETGLLAYGLEVDIEFEIEFEVGVEVVFQVFNTVARLHHGG